VTAQDLTSIIGALGFPIFLVVAIMIIFVKYVWPWVIADQKFRRENEASRHASFIGSFDRMSMTIELLSKAFIEFSARTNEQHEQHAEIEKNNQSVLLTVITTNHTEVIHKLEKIDGKLPNGFGAPKRA
jgi:hypothetical protein